MTPEEIKALNVGRYTFKDKHTSTTPAKYRKLPGHVLVEDFLAPYYPADLRDLAARTRIPLKRLHGLIRGSDRIDERMAESLGRFFRNGSNYWLELQKRYERGETL
jgi:plasmid maintenance system antidote protein VapI